MKKRKLISIILESIIILICLLVTLLTPNKIEHSEKEKMLEASNLTKQCYEKIKEYKISNNIPLVDEDKYESYMIGEMYTDIYTSDGDIQAKCSSINPNFAALYIKMFKDVGLKEGDEVAVVCSGSFICLNISCLCAIEIYGLKACLMASIGASSYGATNPYFNNIDMLNYLYTEGLISTRIDYASFGGYKDIGIDFDKELRNVLKQRILDQDLEFVFNEDFKDNVNDRVNKIYNKCPNLKLFINIGGTSIGLGMGNAAQLYKFGLIRPSVNLRIFENDQCGLMDKFLNRNIPVINMLNMSSICTYYHMPYNPPSLPLPGEGDVYFDISYNLDLVYVALISLACFAIYNIIDHKKKDYN